MLYTFYIFQLEEKIKAIQDKLEASEQKLQQSLRKAETLPTVEAQLAPENGSVNRSRTTPWVLIEEKLQQLEAKLAEKETEITEGMFIQYISVPV